MRSLTWSSLLAVGIGTIAFNQHHAPQHGGASGGGDALSVFNGRCSSCHVVPDNKFEADRAYIRQVYDTA